MVSSPRSPELTAAAERLVAALEMWEDGVQIMREHLRRKAPHATEDEIEDALARWLAEPELADADLVVVPFRGDRSPGARGAFT